jgi:anti-anti-sigma factor
MTLRCVSTPDYDVLSLPESVTLANLPELTPRLSRHVQEQRTRHLALDLSSCTILDSSALRLIINIHKRLAEQQRQLYLLAPSEEVSQLLNDTNLSKALLIIGSTDELCTRIVSQQWEQLAPYSYEQGDQRRLQLQCPVCGSQEVVGYYLDKRNLSWRWHQDEPFPICIDTSTTAIVPYFDLMPIVCAECFLCTVEPSTFHVRDKEKQVIASSLEESEIVALSKGIKKRKAIMDLGVIIADDFFCHPRVEKSCAALYTLVEECAKNTVAKVGSRAAFLVGFSNYVRILYTPSYERDQLINDCRSWLTQSFKADPHLPHSLQAQAYFILMTSALDLQRPKEALQAYNDFTTMMGHIPPRLCSWELDNPAFWYQQCQTLRSLQLA